MPVTIRPVQRREFLRNALTVAGAAAGASLPALQSLNLLAETRRRPAPKGKGGYGPLVPAADLRDGVQRISLPGGFEYRSFSPAGAIMSDGNRVPLAHDGMGVFNMPDGRFRLRNSPPPAVNPACRKVRREKPFADVDREPVVEEAT